MHAHMLNVIGITPDAKQHVALDTNYTKSFGDLDRTQEPA